jgi:uncharacterized protein
MATLAAWVGRHPPLRVMHVAVTLPLPPPHPPPIRIVFASDFHAGPVTPSRILNDACACIRQLAPDVLLLGGDFVSLHARYADSLAAALGHIPAPLGRYAVLGNHDLWADDQPIGAALARAHIQVLINQTVHLPAPYEQISISGLDDPTSGQPDIRALAAAPAAVRIVIMHSPEGVPLIQAIPFDLAFCGHTHGGQVCLPNGFPLWLPRGQFNRQYPAGRYHLGPQPHQDLFVSRGIGYGGLPIRLFAPPDIICAALTWSDLLQPASPNIALKPTT